MIQKSETKEYEATKTLYNSYELPEPSSNPKVRRRTKLFCNMRSCRRYINGFIFGNGYFQTRNKETCDLRNQVWVCTKHDKKV